jgi:hypothetical protein
MADPTNAPVSAEFPPYDNASSAPFIYFDIAPTYGIFNGAIQIELASRLLAPNPDGAVEVKFLATGRLRCSPVAAGLLRDAIEAALKMLEQPQQGPAAATGKLN